MDSVTGISEDDILRVLLGRHGVATGDRTGGAPGPGGVAAVGGEERRLVDQIGDGSDPVRVVHLRRAEFDDKRPWVPPFPQ